MALAIVMILPACGGDPGESSDTPTSAPLQSDSTGTVEGATAFFGQALADQDIAAIIMLLTPHGLESAAALEPFAALLSEMREPPRVEDYGSGDVDRTIRFVARTDDGTIGFVTQWTRLDVGWRIDSLSLDDR